MSASLTALPTAASGGACGANASASGVDGAWGSWSIVCAGRANPFKPRGALDPAAAFAELLHEVGLVCAPLRATPRDMEAVAGVLEYHGTYASTRVRIEY